MTSVAVQELNKTRRITLRLEYDSDLENPVESWLHWSPYSFSRRHANFKDPRELGLGALYRGEDEPRIESIGLRRKLEVGTAFFLSYFEHGQCSWFVKGDHRPGVEFQWDGVRVAGLLVWEHAARELGPKTWEDRRRDAVAFCDRYTEWCNGEGLYYSFEDDSRSEVDDSCGGFFASDLEYLWKEYLAPSLEQLAKTGPVRVRITGSAADRVDKYCREFQSQYPRVTFGDVDELDED